MQGNAGNNSESELSISEAERLNDKSDKTAMADSDVHSFSGNEKGEKSNLNSNRTSGKHIDPGSDGEYGGYAEAPGPYSLHSHPSVNSDNETGQGTSTEQHQSKGNDSRTNSPALSHHGAFHEENTNQTTEELFQMDLKSASQSLHQDNMAESAADLNVKNDGETLASKEVESKDLERRRSSKDSLLKENEEDGGTYLSSDTAVKSVVEENNEKKTETVDSEEKSDDQLESTDQQKTDSLLNTAENVEANDDKE